MTEVLDIVQNIGKDIAVPENPESEGSRLITLKQIELEHGVSRSALHTYRLSSTFPQPIPVEGSTKTLFRADEVAAWFQANPKQQGKKRDRFVSQQQGEPVTTTPAPTDDMTADDVERLVNALSPDMRRAFDAMTEELTRQEIFRARILNDRSDAAFQIRLEQNGEIHGIRKCMCCLLGIPLECAEHEEAVDSYMRWRWDESGWDGWPS